MGINRVVGDAAEPTNQITYLARAASPLGPCGPLVRGDRSQLGWSHRASGRRSRRTADPRTTVQRTSAPKPQQISAFDVAMVKSSVPRGENSSKSVFDTASTIARPIHGAGRPWTVHEAERQRAGEARHRAADRLAVDVADAPDAETLLAEQRPADLRERVGDDVGAPDQREDDGELVAGVDPGQLRADRHQHELEAGPQRGDEQAVGAREHAVHDSRLRPVERRGETAVRVVERQEDPAGQDRVEQVVLQRDRREVGGRFVGDLHVGVVEAGHPQHDEAAAPADHVGDADPPFGVPLQQVEDVEGRLHPRRERLPPLVLGEAARSRSAAAS